MRSPTSRWARSVRSSVGRLATSEAWGSCAIGVDSIKLATTGLRNRLISLGSSAPIAAELEQCRKWSKVVPTRTSRVAGPDGDRYQLQ